MDLGTPLPAGSPTDRRAFTRITTWYRPTRTFPMLGTEAERSATLTVREDRSSVRITGTITPEGLVDVVEVTRAVVSAGSCIAITYSDVPTVLADPAAATAQS